MSSRCRFRFVARRHGVAGGQRSRLQQESRRQKPSELQPPRTGHGTLRGISVGLLEQAGRGEMKRVPGRVCLVTPSLQSPCLGRLARGGGAGRARQVKSSLGAGSCSCRHDIEIEDLAPIARASTANGASDSPRPRTAQGSCHGPMLLPPILLPGDQGSATCFSPPGRDESTIQGSPRPWQEMQSAAGRPRARRTAARSTRPRIRVCDRPVPRARLLGCLELRDRQPCLRGHRPQARVPEGRNRPGARVQLDEASAQ